MSGRAPRTLVRTCRVACGPLLPSLLPRTVAAHESSCGELNELVVVADVQTAVAHVRHDQLAARQERADNRRSHPEIVVVVLGEALIRRFARLTAVLSRLASYDSVGSTRTARRNRSFRAIGG